MKINKTLTALIAGASLSISGQALATTEATTSIKNTATLSFDVNGTSVSDVSSEAEFKVDSKVNMTLISQNSPTADAGDDATLSFKLTNLTNGPMYYVIAGGSNYTVSGTPSTNATLTGDLIYLEKEGDEVTITSTESVPNAAVYSSTIDVELTATATNNLKVAIETSTADKDTNLLGLYYVLADEGTVNYDGIYQDTSTITVSSAHLTATKTVTIKDDGMGTKYAIPGATVTYTIVITSDGSKDAEGVIFTDDLNTNAPDLDFTTISNITVLNNADVALAAPADYTVVNDGTAAGIISLNLPNILADTDDAGPKTDEKLTVSFDIVIK